MADYPDHQKELQIVSARLPDAPRQLAQQVTSFIQELRGTELYKIPGVSETLDLIPALMAPNIRELEPEGIAVHDGHLLVAHNLKHGFCFVPGVRVVYGENAIGRW